jgi:hypothetical protein
MGHIKEPTGIDLVIKSRPLTKEEETAISEYIRTYKKSHSQKRIVKKRSVVPTKRKKVTV